MIIRIAFILALVFCGSAEAVLMGNLYTFNSVVEDNSLDTRKQLLPLAMEQVLIKVTGSRAMLEHSAIEQARQDVDHYVREFSYKEDGDTYMLSINFDEKMIDKLVASTGRDKLSKNRPLIMTWLAIREDHKLEIVGDAAYPDVATFIDTHAQAYGIPMVLPLLDLTERLFVRANDVATFNEIPMQQASGRYNADLVLAGSIIKSADQWHCTWRLYTSEQIIDWSSIGHDLDAEIDSMLLQLNEQLLAHYTNINKPKTLAENSIFVRITGVNNVSEYAKVMDYLFSLSAIKNVEVSNINDQEAVFLISADGGKRAIKTAIGMDRILSEVATEDNYLIYRVNL